MEGFGEEAEDLLRRAEVVEEDVMRQNVERLDQLEDRHTETHLTCLTSEWVIRFKLTFKSGLCLMDRHDFHLVYSNQLQCGLIILF